MSAQMQKGLTDAARWYGVKLIFFASFGDSYSSRNYGKFSKYDEGDCVSFDIPNLKDFDGVIKISTYFSEVIKNHLKVILSENDIPVINIGMIDEEHLSITCDDKATFAKVVDHVVRFHGCRDVYHVAGDKLHNFSFERIDAYRTVLERYKIPFDEKRSITAISGTTAVKQLWIIFLSTAISAARSSLMPLSAPMTIPR